MKKIIQKKIDNLIFLVKIDLSICPNTWIFSDFFLIFDFFCFKKTIKSENLDMFSQKWSSQEIRICFRKKSTHYT